MKTPLKLNTQKLGFEENLPKFHQTKTHNLGSFKQVSSNSLPKKTLD
jgi:hypothetical protein